MSREYSTLDKKIIYTTGALFLDIVIGNAFIGKPLHESLGIKFPDYLQRIENLVFATGWFYTLFKIYDTL